MARLMLLGPLAGLCGFFFLSGQPQILGGIMLWSSGGILYLIFQDIAPQSRLEKHWAPPLGAVFGYCLAMFSEMITHPSL
jgi:ZIP family zinc transporter